MNAQKTWEHGRFIIHEFATLDSTNAYAFDLATAHQLTDGEIIVAHLQNKGKGRLNRDWVSPPGNLYFSLVVKPNVTIDKIPQLSFIGITALQASIAKLTKQLVQTKWPNDLLIEKHKVAGILLESKMDNNHCEFVVIGIGVNIASHPDNVLFPATHLKAQGIDITAQELLRHFLDNFDRLYENWLNFGFKAIRQLWLNNPYRLQDEITVKIDDQTTQGVFEGLDKEGNLLLRVGEKLTTIIAADVL